MLGAAGVASLGVIGVAEEMSARPAAAWGGYQNGYVPLSALRQIVADGAPWRAGVSYWWPDGQAGGVGGVYLEPGAASALDSMLKRYTDTHPGARALMVNEGYRSYAGQVYWANEGSQTTPPGQSNHGFGLAIDFNGSWEGPSDGFTQAEHAWVVANGPAFGYYELSGDYIHFNYTGQITGGAGGGQMEDGEMWYSNIDNYGAVNNGVPPLRNGYSYVQGANGVLRPVGVTESNARQQAGQAPVPIHGSQLGPIAAAFGVYEVTWNGLEPTPTGRIMYGANLAVSRPAW